MRALGARDLAFPRLNLASFYVYCAGVIVTLGATIWGAADTGWTFYVPYSSTTQFSVLPVVIGIFILGVEPHVP